MLRLSKIALTEKSRPIAFLTSLLGVLSIASAAAGSPFFSIDAPSPSVPAVGNNDVLAPGPVIAAPAPAFGLAALFPPDELDAMTTSAPVVGSLHFSVDRATIGIIGPTPDVASESVAGQAAGDIYVTSFAGTNSLLVNQSLLGLIPPVAPGTIVAPPIDDVDALDLSAPLPGFFSLTPGNSFGASGADLLLPGGAIAVPAVSMGLFAADDIDALHIDSGTFDIIFSLAPGSPSLLVASPGCPGPPCSAADLFLVPGALPGFFIPFAPAAALGLLPTDNVNAIDLPEPGSTVMLASGMALLLGLARLRRR